MHGVRVGHRRQPVVHIRARVEDDVRARHPGEGRRPRVHLVAGLVAHRAVVLAEVRVPGPGVEQGAADAGADVAAAQRVRRHAHPVGVAVPLLHRVAELQHVGVPRAGHGLPLFVVVNGVGISPGLEVPAQRLDGAADVEPQRGAVRAGDADPRRDPGPHLHHDGLARIVGGPRRRGGGDDRPLQSGGLRRGRGRGEGRQEGDAREGRGERQPGGRAPASTGRGLHDTAAFRGARVRLCHACHFPRDDGQRILRDWFLFSHLSRSFLMISRTPGILSSISTSSCTLQEKTSRFLMPSGQIGRPRQLSPGRPAIGYVPMVQRPDDPAAAGPG